jgi:hypothetical protein
MDLDGGLMTAFTVNSRDKVVSLVMTKADPHLRDPHSPEDRVAVAAD